MGFVRILVDVALIEEWLHLPDNCSIEGHLIELTVESPAFPDEQQHAPLVEPIVHHRYETWEWDWRLPIESVTTHTTQNLRK